MANPDRDIEGLLADAGDASVFVQDGAGEHEDGKAMENFFFLKKKRNQNERRVPLSGLLASSPSLTNAGAHLPVLKSTWAR